MKYVYGPVASRRLGRSLGVSLIGHKTCQLDCLYCEAGKTTNWTCERKEYVKISEVIAELKAALDTRPQLDFITFSGPGEPTLNSKIGEVADFLKQNYPEYRICLLTNGCAFGDPGLAKELEKIDFIIPSLDGSNEEEFQKLNVPAAGLHFDAYLRNLQSFCRTSKAYKMLELFVAPGVNDSDESIGRFKEIIKTLKVDKVQLNTLDRSGTCPDLKAADESTMMKFAKVLETVTPVEILGRHQYKTPGTITSQEYFSQK